MISRYEKILFLVLAMVFMIGSVIFPSEFLSLPTLKILMNQIPELGLISLALMIGLIASGLNLSVVAVSVLSATLGAIFMSHFPTEGVLSSFVGIMVMVGVGALSGALCGFIISYIEVPAILTTLGMMLLFRGLALNLTKGGSISGFSNVFLYIGTGDVLGIPIPFIIFVVIILILHYVLRYRPFGQQVYRIGIDIEAAKYSGIPVRRHVLLLYIISGIILGIAGVIMTARYNSIRVDYGSSYLINSIVVVSLGGFSIKGERGTIIGVIIALLLVSLMVRILNLASIDEEIIDSILGLLLLINILGQYMINKKANFEL